MQGDARGEPGGAHQATSDAIAGMAGKAMRSTTGGRCMAPPWSSGAEEQRGLQGDRPPEPGLLRRSRQAGNTTMGDAQRDEEPQEDLLGQRASGTATRWCEGRRLVAGSRRLHPTTGWNGKDRPPSWNTGSRNIPETSRPPRRSDVGTYSARAPRVPYSSGRRRCGGRSNQSAPRPSPDGEHQVGAVQRDAAQHAGQRHQPVVVGGPAAVPAGRRRARPGPRCRTPALRSTPSPTARADR